MSEPKAELAPEVAFETDADSERVSITACATPEVVDLVQGLIEGLWVRWPQVAFADRFRFETGLIEVLANIVEHAFRLSGSEIAYSRRLTVELEVSASELGAVLCDDGRPFEIDLSEVTLPDADAESGRGLAMALASLDRLDHERVEGRNRWTLATRRTEP